MKIWWKWLAGLVAPLVLLAAGAAWWLHGNLDAIVRRGIAHYGSRMTRAHVEVDAVHIRGADGTGVVRGLVVGNPAGFRTAHALKVAAIEIAVDMRTLADPAVVIRRIVIDSPDLIYEKGDGTTNFDAIQKNIARALGTPAGSAGDGGSAAGSAGDGGSPPRRLIVDELVIRHARAQAGTSTLGGRTVSATLPDITLRNVGRAEGGVTPAQLGQRVASALGQRVVASLGVDHVVKSLGERVKGFLRQ